MTKTIKNIIHDGEILVKTYNGILKRLPDACRDRASVLPGKKKLSSKEIKVVTEADQVIQYELKKLRKRKNGTLLGIERPLMEHNRELASYERSFIHRSHEISKMGYVLQEMFQDIDPLLQDAITLLQKQADQKTSEGVLETEKPLAEVLGRINKIILENHWNNIKYGYYDWAPDSNEQSYILRLGGQEGENPVWVFVAIASIANLHAKVVRSVAAKINGEKEEDERYAARKGLNLGWGSDNILLVSHIERILDLLFPRRSGFTWGVAGVDEQTRKEAEKILEEVDTEKKKLEDLLDFLKAVPEEKRDKHLIGAISWLNRGVLGWSGDLTTTLSIIEGILRSTSKRPFEHFGDIAGRLRDQEIRNLSGCLRNMSDELRRTVSLTDKQIAQLETMIRALRSHHKSAAAA